MKNDPLEILISKTPVVNYGRNPSSREYLIQMALDWNHKQITGDEFAMAFYRENKTAILKEHHRQLRLKEAQERVKKLSLPAY